MSGIVCAVRGGPESRATVNRAVELAEERALPLYFLYVFNLDFLLRTSQSRLDNIEESMKQMGEFILLMAQDQAAEGGVEAKGVMRQGKVGEEIVALCREVEADLVVLGKPRGEEEPDVFTMERLERFALGIGEQTGADVLLVERGP